MNNLIFFRQISSPIGLLTLISDGVSLTGCYMNSPRHELSHLGELTLDDSSEVLTEAAKQLNEFFAGERKTFDLPLDASTGTDFQRQCWNELTKIPHGETWSYGDMAKRIGSASASRAVGAANGRNPISIIVPCHRVIGASGKLVGFGGGIPRKAALLGFERAIAFGESAEEYWCDQITEPLKAG